jgi:hypothetical protein
MPQVFGVTRRDQPSKSAEAVSQQFRAGSRGELYVIPFTQGTYPLADEGAYFTGVNPTPGTGIIHALTTAWSATAALFCLRNTDAEGAKRIYVDYAKLLTIGTAPTATTSIRLAITVDNTNRYSSGGTSITPKNVNMDSTQATIAALNFGAVVLTAASGSVRDIARESQPPRAAPALVTGDTFFYNFGQVSAESLATVGAAAPATAAAQFTAALPPVIIGGGDSLNFHLYYPAAATTAPTYEFEIAWWER